MFTLLLRYHGLDAFKIKAYLRLKVNNQSTPLASASNSVACQTGKERK